MLQCSLLQTGFNGTWLKLCYKQTLFTTIGRDGNNNTNLYSFAIIEGENNNSWAYLFDYYTKAILAAQERAFAYEAFASNGLLGAPRAWPRDKELLKQSSISNRDKGLQNGVRGLSPDVNHTYCVQHLGKNVQENHSSNAKKLFLKLVYALNRERFDAILAKLQAKCGDVSNIILHKSYTC